MKYIILLFLIILMISCTDLENNFMIINDISSHTQDTCQYGFYIYTCVGGEYYTFKDSIGAWNVGDTMFKAKYLRK